MPLFDYHAVNHAGVSRRGWLPAADVSRLADQLEREGFALIQARPKRLATRNHTQLQSAALIACCQQLSQLLTAGIPLVQAIEMLARESETARMAWVYMQLQQALEAGQPLSQAMMRLNQFPAVVCHLVATGEHTGQLPEVLAHLAAVMHWQAQLVAQLKRGLIYPALLALMVGLAAVVMLTFLVPQMTGFLISLGQTLPWSTRLLIALSNGVIDYGWQMLSGLLALIGVLVWMVRRYPTVAWWWHQRLLRLPVAGQLIQHLLLARLCRFLGLMYRAGIPLLEALALCQPMLPHPVLRHACEQVIQRIQSGRGLAQSFADAGVFPPFMLRMLALGETTGALDATLTQLSQVYDNALQTRLSTLLALFEPVLTMVLGGMLLLLMAAVMLPVYDSFSQFSF